ncbi:MAG: NADH-quinone oxidoreductase subunit NuoH [Methanophagales archaeon]|nr:NADH-quinone oxidoreductase subunit NuoH [Methanophagales archaeon]
MIDINSIISEMTTEGSQVIIPLIQQMLGLLPDIPMIKLMVSFILWKPIFAALICPGFSTLGILLLFFPWIERKLCARIQWRVGPREVVRWLGGIIQLLADTLKFIFQEVIIHKDAHKFYFLQFPLLTFIPALLPILFVNIASADAEYPLVAIQSPYAIQIMLALICLFPVFILGMGWASNSRYAFIGTVREAFMYFAYEVPFIIAVLAMIILFGTSGSVAITEWQSTWWRWGIICNPFAALAFFIGSAMATSRLPFEIPEADQEVAFGPFVEYSGIGFGLVYIVCYEKMYVLSALMTMLFLGGGNGPYIAPLGDLSGAVWFLLKTIIVMTTLAILRPIYPRYRLDQGLGMGWSAILFLALIALVLSIIMRSVGMVL